MPAMYLRIVISIMAASLLRVSAAGDGPNACYNETIRCRICNVFRDDADAKYVFLTLSTSNGTACAYHPCQDADAATRGFLPYVGCTVRICTTVMPMSEPHCRQHLRIAYHIASTNDITVLAKADKSPFDVPLLTEAPPALSEIESCGTRKATGVVVARWHGDTFLIRMSDGEHLKIQLRDRDLPALGETVEVVGEIATDLYHYNLFQGQWRISQATIPPVDGIRTISLDTIFCKDGRRIINTSLHGQTIRVRGLLKSVLSDENGRRRLLLAEGGLQIVADCSSLPESCTTLPEGCELEVTGVGIQESENWHPNLFFPRVTGFYLVPRTTTDIRIIRQPPWWTPARFAAALSALIVLLVLILIWNAALRALVARKSRALLKEQVLKLKETFKVDERTRLAAELHDFHSQNLTAIAYQISTAQDACRDGDPKIAAHCLETAADMLRSCRSDLRHCLWDLRSDALDLTDFSKAIRLTVAPVAGESNVSIRFSGCRAQISDSTAHAILCVLRELTSNAVNHGHAKSVRIAGSQTKDLLLFSVRDDGCGFDPASRPNRDNGHFGLDGIQERLRRLGGELEIRSAPGEGTDIRISIPHQQETSA